MPSLGFEPMIRAFEQAKTVYALDRAATVIGGMVVQILEFLTSALTRGHFHTTAVLPPGKYSPVPSEWGGLYCRGLDAVDEKKIILLPRKEPRFFDCPACSLVATPTELSGPMRKTKNNTY
jgi:hypothetical protein